MKYGLLFHYWMKDAGKCNYLEVAKRIKAAGFDVMEIDAGDLYKMTDEEIAALHEAVTALGLEVSVNNGTGADVDPSADDPAIRAAGIAYLEKLMRQMVKLGTNTLIGGLISAWPADWSVDHDKERTWGYAVASMKQVCKTAEALGITLHLEILNRYESFLINDVAEGLKFIDEVGSPNLLLLIDTFHSNIEEDDLPEAMRRAGKKLGHMHLDENNRKLPGLGSLPWKEMGEVLRELDFQGYLCIEPFMLKNGPLSKAVHLWREFVPADISDEAYDQLLLDSLAFLKANFEA